MAVRRIVIAAGLAAAFGGASRASGQPASKPSPPVQVDALEAQAHADFEAGRLEEALRGFERLYRLRPEPVTLFVIGNLQRQLGRCDRAIETLEDYLATGPSAAGARQARGWIDGCRAAPSQRLDVLPIPDEPVPDPEPIVAPPPRRDGDPGRGRRRAALVLGGVAIIAAGGAVVTELQGRAFLDDARAAAAMGDVAARDRHYDAANQRHYFAQGAAIGAGACVVGAVILWISGRHGEPRVAAAPKRGGAVVTWSGGF